MIYFVILILALNILWFGMGFRYFCFQSESATKMLLPKTHRAEPYFSIVTHAVKFIGAFNFALMVLSIIVLVRYHFPRLDMETNAALFFVFSLAHFGQFWVNVPLARKERKGQNTLWPVLKGRMYFIFRTDFILAILNLLIGCYFVYQIVAIR